MTTFAYPNQRFTTNLGLSLFGMDEVLADNMNLIDAAYGAGSSINVNGTLVSSPNLSSTLPVPPAGNTIVSFHFDANGNISGYVPSAIAPTSAWSSLTGTLSNGQVIPYADAGISRLGAASLAIGNGTAGDTTGDLELGSMTITRAVGALQSLTLKVSDSGGLGTIVCYGSTANQTAGHPDVIIGAGVATTDQILVSGNHTGSGATYLINEPTSDPNMLALFSDINGPTMVITSGASLISQNLLFGVLDGGGGTGVNKFYTLCLDPYGSHFMGSPSNTSNTGWDSGFSRISPGVVGFGNGTRLDVSGTVQAANANLSGILEFNGLDTLGPVGSFTTTPNVGNRNNVTGALGMQFTVSTAITVSQLGRGYSAGNAQNHVVNLWISTNTSTPLATGTVLAASSSDANGVKWVSVTPVVLTPGHSYTIMVDETNGGDNWADNWTPALQPQISVVTACYGNTSGYITGDGTPLKTYDSPAMLFTYQATQVDAGISRLAAASLAIGNGTPGNTTGQITATTFTVAASGAAPTSAGTAGTAGQIIYYSGFAYLCTVTGAAGSATWNKLNMTAV